MGVLKDILPKPISTTSTFYDHSKDPWFKERLSSSNAEASKTASFEPNPGPPYGKRSEFIPGKHEDFGDGGAFPEIHITQYPLGMGRQGEKPRSKILTSTVDSQAEVTFDSVAKQTENASKIVYSQHKDLIPKIVSAEEKDSEELQKEIKESTQRTKEALEKIVNVKLSTVQPKNVLAHSLDSKFVKYQPNQQSSAFNSGARERIIRIVEMPVDPLDPPKLKHKMIPKASGSPPVPVMHSPPRPVSVEDQHEWKIPPCNSNWKNPKGYTIPLDKRVAADGRSLQEVQINDNFATVSEALYVAEHVARVQVATRSKLQRELMRKEKDKNEQKLHELARTARLEKTGLALASVSVGKDSVNGNDNDDDMDVECHEPTTRRETIEKRMLKLERDTVREGRRREREKERRLEARDAAMGKKSNLTRDRDREISEKVALGMANSGRAGKGDGEGMYDQRLFNQDKGMRSGFAADDQYNIYDKGLFTDQPTLSTLYRPKKDADSDMYIGADEQLENIAKTERFKPDKAFIGASERPGKRDRPVDFVKAEENDPFGLDVFLTEVKKGKKAMDNVGGSGTMRAHGGSGRTRFDFEKGGHE